MTEIYRKYKKHSREKVTVLFGGTTRLQLEADESPGERGCREMQGGERVPSVWWSTSPTVNVIKFLSHITVVSIAHHKWTKGPVRLIGRNGGGTVVIKCV
jgi:hypothetical protein